MKYLLYLYASIGLISYHNNLGQSDPIQYATYTNPEQEFSISYPSNWDTTEHLKDVVFSASEITSDTTDRFSESLNLSVFPNEGVSMTEMTKQFVEAAKERIGNPAVTQQKLKNKQGMQYVSITTEIEKKGYHLVIYTSLYRSKDNFYMITQLVETEKKEQYLPTVLFVQDNFIWAKK